MKSLKLFFQTKQLSQCLNDVLVPFTVRLYFSKSNPIERYIFIISGSVSGSRGCLTTKYQPVLDIYSIITLIYDQLDGIYDLFIIIIITTIKVSDVCHGSLTIKGLSSLQLHHANVNKSRLS